MDVFGNKVDNYGNSKENKSLKKHFTNKKEILSNLSEKIIDEFMKGTVVFPSTLVAFTAFEIIRKKFKNIDIINLISLPEDEVTISLEKFKENYNKIIIRINQLALDNNIKLSNELKLDTKKQISNGCQRLGLYHTPKPVILKNNSVVIKNMKMLYYYRNRLDGFNLDKCFSN